MHIVRSWFIAGVGVVLTHPSLAQLRVPTVTLPGQPVPGLTQTATGVTAAPFDELRTVRKSAIAALIRRNRQALEADPQGEPIVRNELVAFSLSDSGIASARALGFAAVREQSSPELGLTLTVLKPPSRWTTVEALKKLRKANPDEVFDFNHIYTGSAADPRIANADNGVVPATNHALVDAPAGSEAATSGVRVGLIDSGVDLAHPAFRQSNVRSWGCAGRSIPNSHGTAVASLLVGHAEGFHGVVPGAQLYAANVYCDSPAGGALDELAAAFGWLAHEQVAVINVSLVGPDNAALAQIVRSLTSRGFLLVAAVGNDGPAAPPLYPASYPKVVGVTGVDAHRHVLIEAARGRQVMFAARGANLSAAATGNGPQYTEVRGTSFAAPIVAGMLARELRVPDIAQADAAVEALARTAIDLGTAGRDLTYGIGLVGFDYPVEETAQAVRMTW